MHAPLRRAPRHAERMTAVAGPDMQALRRRAEKAVHERDFRLQLGAAQLAHEDAEYVQELTEAVDGRPHASPAAAPPAPASVAPKRAASQPSMTRLRAGPHS